MSAEQEEESALQKEMEKKCCAYCRTIDTRCLRCSACANAYYCSKECQRTHWKTHKATCKAHQKNKEDAKKQGCKREFQLLLQWRDKVKGTYLQPIFMATFTEELMAQQPPTHVLEINVEFNYNWLTFVPTKNPKAMLPPAGWDELCARLQPDTERLPQGHLMHFIYITTTLGGKPFASIVPLAIKPDYQEIKRDLLPLEHLMLSMKINRHDLALESRLFTDEWGHKKQENLFKQWDVVRLNRAFGFFMINALRLRSSSPMHKTHVVALMFEYGSGLGEIKEFFGFSTLDLDYAKALCQHRMDQEHLDRMFDLENSPEIEEMREPNSNLEPALTPVILLEVPYDKPGTELSCSPHHVAIVTPQTIQLEGDGRGLTPVDVCDELAERYYNEVKQIPLPPVESPSIH